MTVTKRVRMTEEEASRLAEMARRDGKTESDVLREGLLAYDRDQGRRDAIEKLIAMAERDKDVKWVKAGGFK